MQEFPIFILQLGVREKNPYEILNQCLTKPFNIKLRFKN